MTVCARIGVYTANYTQLFIFILPKKCVQYLIHAAHKAHCTYIRGIAFNVCK